MRKLDRTSAKIPACLASFMPGRDKWSKLDYDKREEIKASLEKMQGRRCAYCEGDLDNLGQHIEHFRSRDLFPSFTFDWNNLYWSCDQADSCGRFKDLKADSYNVSDLLDPCHDNPDKFFRFRSNGTVNIRQNLTESQRKRAAETLRVFSLDAEWGRLRKMRQLAVLGYEKVVEDAISCGFGPDDLKQYFEQELQIAATLPFSTAIRHVLTEGL